MTTRIYLLLLLFAAILASAFLPWFSKDEAPVIIFQNVEFSKIHWGIWTFLFIVFLPSCVGILQLLLKKHVHKFFRVFPFIIMLLIAIIWLWGAAASAADFSSFPFGQGAGLALIASFLLLFISGKRKEDVPLLK